VLTEARELAHISLADAAELVVMAARTTMARIAPGQTNRNPALCSNAMSRSDKIRTSRGFVLVPYEKRQELRRRLDVAGAHGAAEDLRNHRVLPEWWTREVLEVLRYWAMDEDIGDEMRELQAQLYDDVRNDLPRPR
jgi:hypothetical protein